MKINFECLSEDKLERIRWEFYLSGTTFLLNLYAEEHRESTRKRNWEVDKIYKRIGDSRREYRPFKCLNENNVNVTEEIKQMVIKELLGSITFGC